MDGRFTERQTLEMLLMLRARLVLVAPLTAAMLSACVVAPYPARPVVYSQPAPAYAPPVEEYVVDTPPPAPYAEVIPPLPYEGAVWIGGYWGWNGGRHYWVPGRYERGRPGYGWRPHSWVQEGGRWHMRAGGWERR